MVGNFRFSIDQKLESILVADWARRRCRRHSSRRPITTTHPPTPIWPPPLKCSIPHSYLIRARSTAHSEIFLYKSFFKGLYYTLSHTYNAYIYVCSFPFFYCQIWFTIFFCWKLLCIALSVLQIYSAVCKLSLYTCQGYIHHVSFEGIHCLEKLFLSSKICLNIRNYLWNLRKWHYSV